ncbi:hypothetical protein GQ53DRAFT_835432 [Thozetella sp. PMI_491]|nr:hypothetical protein GQ53DRAFT_835432 [Thozetella sp. PMI_491]
MPSTKPHKVRRSMLSRRPSHHDSPRPMFADATMGKRAKFSIISLVSVALAGLATAAPVEEARALGLSYFPTCNFVNSGTWGTRDAAESLRDELAARLDDVFRYTSAEPIILAQVTLHGITTYVSAQGNGDDSFDTYGQAAIHVQSILDNCDFIHCGTVEFNGDHVCYIEGTKATVNQTPIIRVYGDSI